MMTTIVEQQAEREQEQKLAIPARRWGPFAWTLGALFVLAILNAGVGPVPIPPGTVLGLLLDRLPGISLELSAPATFSTILYQIRLPNMVLIALTGMALGGSGAAFQGLFRNPLADPYLIGVASGAGLGAVLILTGNWTIVGLGAMAVPLAAFSGALLTVAMVYVMARVGRTTPITTLLLAGVAIGTFTSALTSLVMMLTEEGVRRALSWMLGGFALGGWTPVWASLPYLAIGLSTLILLGRPLNVLQLGDEEALQLGLNVERFKLVILVAASLTAATAVAFSGVIGFVGLIVPHVMRLLWGGDYRRLIPLATLGGGALLLGADILARMILAPRELPVGIVTSVIGAPFFLWLLRRARQEVFW